MIEDRHRLTPMKPETWASEAVHIHGWKHAYRIVNGHARDFLGDDKTVPNPHREYWQTVKAWIERSAPRGELSEEQ